MRRQFCRITCALSSGVVKQRDVSPTLRNFARIFANRTGPTETGLVGWGARTRTWEWRNQNPLISRVSSMPILKYDQDSTDYPSMG
jgi:hypothetical protein